MLPSVPRDHPQADEWRIRRESYAHLQEHAIPDIWLGATRVLELGAGCGWLSYRLATHGYRVVAVDRLDDEADGLGACRHYPIAFPAVQADFDALPFEPYQFDVVVFNASLHYSTNPAASLREAARMVSPGGAVAVMDSPTFYRDADGEAMVADQERRMRTEHGLAEPVRAGMGFLTYARDRARVPIARPPVPVLPIARTAVVAAAAPDRTMAARTAAGRVRRVGRAMIVLFNPASTTPGKQPLPLSLMSLAAVLEGRHRWTLVDGNVTPDPAAEIVAQLSRPTLKRRPLRTTSRCSPSASCPDRS